MYSNLSLTRYSPTPVLRLRSGGGTNITEAWHRVINQRVKVAGGVRRLSTQNMVLQLLVMDWNEAMYVSLAAILSCMCSNTYPSCALG